MTYWYGGASGIGAVTESDCSQGEYATRRLRAMLRYSHRFVDGCAQGTAGPISESSHALVNVPVGS